MKAAKFITQIIDFFYIRPVRRLIPIQPFRYAVCGGANLLLGWVIYYLVYNYVIGDHWLNLGIVVMSPHIQALFIQFPITFFTGFWLNRHVAFRQSPLRGRTQLLRYFASVAGSFLLNYAFMKLFVEAIGIYPTIAKPITDILVVIYSFCMAKFFTFRGSK